MVITITLPLVRRIFCNKIVLRGTAQRNISAALVVGAQNFDADVITYVMVINSHPRKD